MRQLLKRIRNTESADSYRQMDSLIPRPSPHAGNKISRWRGDSNRLRGSNARVRVLVEYMKIDGGI